LKNSSLQREIRIGDNVHHGPTRCILSNDLGMGENAATRWKDIADFSPGCQLNGLKFRDILSHASA
jgi:hypothetical protein